MPNAACFHLLEAIALVTRCACVRRTPKYFLCGLTNPNTAPNALSLHNEHNSVNYSHSPANWSVTYVAVQPGVGLSSHWRTRFDSFDSDNPGVSGCDLRFASHGLS